LVQCAVTVQAEVATALQLNATFKVAFELAFIAQLAASAGVTTDRVTITGYVAVSAAPSTAAAPTEIVAVPSQRARLLLQAEAEAGALTVLSTVEVCAVPRSFRVGLNPDRFGSNRTSTWGCWEGARGLPGAEI
jgi:hypothetical protein